ncbi:MAG: amidase family protein [Burkholderiaceae bacterium]
MAELPPTLTALRAALAAGELSAPEALRLQDERFRAGHARYRCASWLPAQPPLQAAANGDLAGIALAHKDIFAMRDRLPGLGCGPGEYCPGQTPARALASLERAGAVELGALAMAEYACGATGANSWLGRCVNPLNDQAVVGGSSSGSAAAVAAGLVYGSLGTDTAGSVRIPAATCGVLGLKTTHGALPTEGVHPLAPSLDSVGIIAGSCADAAQLLAALRPMEQQRTPVPARPRLRAWLSDGPLHDEVARALEEAARELGAQQQALPAADFERWSAAAEIVLRAETAATHYASLSARTAPRALADIGLAGLSMAEWRCRALAARPAIAARFVDEYLRDADILMLPALARPIPDWDRVTPGDEGFDAAELLGLHRYMGFVNYLGLPALVLPVARDARGLPIAVQLIARPHHEETLLTFAERFEASFCGTRPKAGAFH